MNAAAHNGVFEITLGEAVLIYQGVRVMLRAILEDREGEPIRLEYMGDGFFYACQQESGRIGREHQITVSEEQLRIWVQLAVQNGLNVTE